MHKAVVKSVLLYGNDIWVVMGAMIKVLEGFHRWVARRIMGMAARNTTGKELDWPLT